MVKKGYAYQSLQHSRCCQGANRAGAAGHSYQQFVYPGLLREHIDFKSNKVDLDGPGNAVSDSEPVAVQDSPCGRLAE